ncbi:hypothetical protein JW710_00115 [Candidatus Dojkabacteria bacterium]|nr:hypothetical protein [Candidatus Dojkabacteria bacterium]
MLESFLSAFDKSIPRWIVWLYIIISGIVGYFIYWLQIKRRAQKKLELSIVSDQVIKAETESISSKFFDYVGFSLIFSVFLSRFMYIWYRSSEFAGTRWFWLPYEKIEGQVYIMESFPWLFLRFWDRDFLIEGIVFGILFSVIFVSKALGFKWKEIFEPTTNFLWYVLCCFLLFIAVVTGRPLHIVFFIFVMISGVARYVVDLLKNIDFPLWLKSVVDVFWRIVTYLSAPILILVSQNFEAYPNKGVLIFLDLGIIFMSIWLLVSMVLFKYYGDIISKLEEKLQSGGKVGDQNIKSRVDVQIVGHDTYRGDTSRSSVKSSKRPKAPDMSKIKSSPVSTVETSYRKLGASIKRVFPKADPGYRKFSLSYRDFTKKPSRGKKVKGFLSKFLKSKEVDTNEETSSSE